MSEIITSQSAIDILPPTIRGEFTPGRTIRANQSLGGLIARDYVTREELAAFAPPTATRTHAPVAHVDFLGEVVDILGRNQFGVVKERLAVDKNGARFFGVLDIDAVFDDYTLAVGIRGSYDKSLKAEVVGGDRVTVCENLCFYGEVASAGGKNTPGLNLRDLLALWIDRLKRHFESVVRTNRDYKSIPVTNGAVKELLWDSFIAAKAPLPGTRKVANLVAGEWLEPRHDVFQDRTLWSLKNAFTQVFQDEYDPVQQYEAASVLPRLLAPFAGN
jgi:hypothetical protein